MTASTTGPSRVTVHFVAYDDPLAQPLLIDLEREYDERYSDIGGIGTAADEIYRYPAGVFAADGGGAFLVLREGEEVVAGAAFMTPGADALDRVETHLGARPASAVEVKRVWTHPDHRRRGLARRAMAELEAEATRRGIPEIVLSTGPRQPEAVGLYLATGYTPLFDPDARSEVFEGLYFHKRL